MCVLSCSAPALIKHKRQPAHRRNSSEIFTVVHCFKAALHEIETENAEKQRTTKALQIFNIIKPSFARTHLTHYSCNQADVTVIYYTIYCMLYIILYLNTSSPLVKQLSSVQAYSETHKSHVDNLSLVRAVQTFLSVQFLLRLIVVIYFIVSPT